MNFSNLDPDFTQFMNQIIKVSEGFNLFIVIDQEKSFVLLPF